MPSDDLKTAATSNTDFYELLGVSSESSQKDIERAWRRAALRWHPDKVKPNDTTAKENFFLAQIGYEILSQPELKALYDNTRNARLQRKRQNALLAGKRRQMADDLDARERRHKKARAEEDDEEDKLERELRRLAEDGKRRRKEKEDALRKSLQQEAKADGQEAKTDGQVRFRRPFGPTSSTLDLEELTMIRLKNAERKRLAKELQKEDEEVAAASEA